MLVVLPERHLVVFSYHLQQMAGFEVKQTYVTCSTLPDHAVRKVTLKKLTVPVQLKMAMLMVVCTLLWMEPFEGSAT